jgi:hypothetical protein
MGLFLTTMQRILATFLVLAGLPLYLVRGLERFLRFLLFPKSKHRGVYNDAPL